MTEILKRNWRKLVRWWYGNDILAYQAWTLYHVGPFGYGDPFPPPPFPEPKLPAFLQKELDTERELLRMLRRDSFRDACIEVLGEDPDDWGEPWEMQP